MGHVLNEIGNILCTAREEQNLELNDIARILKIRRIYLEGLEKGDVSEIPGNVYIMGYLKEYATFLKLDVEEIILCYKQDEKFDENAREEEVEFDEPGIRRWAKIFMAFPIIAGTTLGAMHPKSEDYTHKPNKPYTINNQTFNIQNLSDKK